MAAGGSADSIFDTNQNPSKKLKSEEMAEDRLSALPDVLILHILSFLDTRETVKTCCLSKRWEFVWTGISKIYFGVKPNTEKSLIFVEQVWKMLAMCRDLSLFFIDINSNEYASSVDSWVYNLVKNKVKDIRLKLFIEYKIPQVLFSHSSVVNLHLHRCHMIPRGVIEWRLLKRLSFDWMELSDSVMEKILTGCPVLETLSLKSFWGLTSLNISSPNLTTLVIYGHFCSDEVQISAPYVRDLTIDVNVDGGTLLWFNNLSSVVRADLEFYGDIKDEDYTSEEAVHYIEKLFESLRSVNELELGALCIEVLSTLEMKGWNISPDSTRLCLKLSPFNHEGSIPGILCMLKCSPYLETLVIKGDDIPAIDDSSDDNNSESNSNSDSESNDDSEEEYASMAREMIITRDPALEYLANGNLDLILNHLKTIEIINFAGEAMPILVERLLKISKVLYTMAIKDSFESSLDENATYDLCLRLLSLSKASDKGFIIFE